MRHSLIAAAVAAAALLTASAMAAPSGDTCTYTAGATGTYTVTIATSAGSQQSTIGFNAPGLTIKNISISGKNGNFTTQGLPPGTSAAWASDEPLTGSVSASLTVTGSPTGKIGIVPSTARATPATTADPTTVYDAVSCTSTGTPSVQTVSFSVTPHAVWNAAKHGWLVVVKVPTGGVVSAVQPKASTLQPMPASIAPHPLVQVHRVSTIGGRSVTLTVKPTSKGQASLASAGVLHVKLLVTFDAEDGREGHKTLSLTLRK